MAVYRRYFYQFVKSVSLPVGVFCSKRAESDCAVISESESQLLYAWRFTANQFVLAPSPLRLTTRIFFSQLDTCGHSSYITSSLMRGWLCHLQLLLVLASAHSFYDLRPVRLATVFYDTSLFVASYDSQGYGGGIRPRFHTGVQSSKIMLWPIFGRPVCLGVKHPSGAYDRIFIAVRL
jgi:hypothetical protein